ncbi:MAG: quaternary ammonium compound efflux SMR transporter SugE [Nitrosomonas sp.]|nr:MAG: quaternary ammonium compound efflux SMR transporter SugE [Nitrosomonas sp.]
MSWVVLLLAGLFEVGWVIALKYSDGFTRLLPSVLAIAAIVISLGLLGVALKEMPLGTAYAIWTGIGAIGAVIAGILLFGDSISPLRIISLILVIAGLIGLKLSH